MSLSSLLVPKDMEELGFEDVSHYRLVKLFNLSPKASLSIIFKACPGPECWTPQIWLENRLCNERPTKQDVIDLCRILTIEI